MVIFDLVCLNGHHFEGWFTDLTDLEGQLAEGQIFCPICGDDNVSRRPSTFGLVRARPNSAQVLPEGQAKKPDQDSLAVKAFRKLVELSARLEKDFVDVGSSFTTEALKMHYGVAPTRNIRGNSTPDEEEILRGEGVEFFKLPILSRKNTAS
ncbi:MAG: DUF1178 family protein [Deltaproteobacteria bacterium]|jgi:hypothetical protein|nr:DUF1178 family protein [Deltaproteobacteria bacterium]